MSPCTSWISSWFISEYMRSLAGKVSKVWDSGAIVELEPVVRLNVSVRIAVIHKILQQDRCGLGRCPSEYPALPSQRIGERAHGMRLEEAQVVVVEKPEILGLHARESDRTLIRDAPAGSHSDSSRHRMRPPIPPPQLGYVAASITGEDA